MNPSILVVAVGLAVAGAIAAASAQDADAVITERQDAMKAQGRSLGAMRAFLEDKGDLAAAQAGGAQLVQSLPTIPSMFAQKTSMADYPGKSYAKPEIWAQWDKFNADTRAAIAQAEALNTALNTVLKGGDKTAITTALAALARDVPGATDNPGACGTRHKPFRERKT